MSARAAAVDTLARTLYGEARGESLRGIEAVAATIVNRAAKGGWFGDGIEAVCRKPFQFSCWNADDPNRPLLDAAADADPVFALCRRVAHTAVAGALPDPTGGATHYHAKGVKPRWAAGLKPVAVVGRHLFYKDVP